MKKKTETLGTIWEIGDELWKLILPILLRYWPQKKTGRPVANWRKALNGIIYRMRTGCQWNRLPKEFGDDSTVHRWFQRWCKDGVMQQIWAVLLEQCEEMAGVEWKWQAADGCLGKARFGGALWVPTPRIGPKTGRKRTSSSMAKAGRWR
jgi:putative transposase